MAVLKGDSKTTGTTLSAPTPIFADRELSSRGIGMLLSFLGESDMSRDRDTWYTRAPVSPSYSDLPFCLCFVILSMNNDCSSVKCLVKLVLLCAQGALLCTSRSSVPNALPEG